MNTTLATSVTDAHCRLRLEIRGAVQGVGFRPFVYRLATEAGLAGWVLNGAAGVIIEADGTRTQLERFSAQIEREHPSVAKIISVERTWLASAGFQGFTIAHSDDAGAKSVQVLPDLATCPQCLAELRDPADRRYRYPFTNCTNCGPRFTIVTALPYDRPSTTMAGFTLCPRCREEYENPLDRRFHAQPNACPVCGPALVLWKAVSGEDKGTGRQEDGGGGREDKGTGGRGGEADLSMASPCPRVPVSPCPPVPVSPCPRVLSKREEALHGAVEALRSGQIVAVKGLGGFHLMCDARDEAAVARLRVRKNRPHKPFALMVRDLAMAAALCELPQSAADLLRAPEAPIVLLDRRRVPSPPAPLPQGERGVGPQPAAKLPPLPAEGEGGRGGEGLAANIAPGNPTLGLMLPATPLHHLLLDELGFPVVATSGNLSDEPICIDEGEALARLGGIADLLLTHDRPIARHADDSVAMVLHGEPRLLRRARGYAPAPVLLRHAAPCILGVGAQLKSVVALSVGRQVFLSQHIGDLDAPEARAAFARVVADLTRLYAAQPVAIAHDLHPGYFSTAFANKLVNAASALSPQPSALSFPIQHHHAHFAACLAENQFEGEALGIIWDGTGYGLDGTIWGGECLYGAVAASRRVASLRPFVLPGGDAAVREPRRVALALLYALEGEGAWGRDELEPVRSFTGSEHTVLRQMITRGLNTVPTSSAGRLCDGVAALLGLCQTASFEGEAAIMLEYAADPHERGCYPLELTGELLDWHPTVAALLADLRRGVGVDVISARFHNALVAALVATARRFDPPAVALSGGCFQNRLLTERAAAALEATGRRVLLHRLVPPNDGGISLGQVAAAAAQMRA